MTADPLSPTPKPAPVWRGVRESIPVAVAIWPFGMLFGALAVANALTPGEAVLMSATVFAGASQMVGIEMFGHHVSPALIVFSLFVVNFRHVLYSAVFGRRIAGWPTARKAAAFFLLVDPMFAESERKAERGLPIEVGWYFGMAISLWLCWILQTALGAALGRLLRNPHALGLDFLLPIYFLGLVMGFRARPLWGPVVLTSALVSTGAYRLVGSPWHVTLGAGAGVLVAALTSPPREAVSG